MQPGSRRADGLSHRIKSVELTIEKLVYGGDGLARLPADERGPGKAVFVPFVLAGERVAATIVQEKPGFARGHADEILQASPARIDPGCPYFVRCGGCHYQHTSYEHQLDVKAAILKENLRRAAKLDLPVELTIHPSAPWNYRNRTRMRVQTSPEFALGYYKFGSHELLPVEQCPISSPLINRAIAAVWQLGRSGGFDPEILEVEFFANAEDSELLVELYVQAAGTTRTQKQNPRLAPNEKRDLGCKQIAQTLQDSIPGAIGAAVFPLEAHASQSKAELPPLAVSGATALNYKTAHAGYRVSAGAFFQVNRFLTDELVEIVVAKRSGRTALDLYAGVGLFSSVLSREFERVIAVESSPQSSADLAYNSPANVKAVRATVDQYLKSSRPKADLIVVDPPRSGLGERVVRALADTEAPAITYVSCDPATLARDLVVLLAAGYRVEQAHLVDLFPQTFHLETVLHLAR